MEEQCREECKKIRIWLDERLMRGQTEEIFTYLQERFGIIKYDNDLMAIWYMGKISEKERENSIATIFEKENSIETLLNRYMSLKFYLRRIEHGILDCSEQFYSFLEKRNVSEYELIGIMESCIFDKEKVHAFFMV